MPRINAQELNLLKQYDFCKKNFILGENPAPYYSSGTNQPSMLLAVRNNGGKEELCTIDRNCVTCWNCIRSWFKKGPLYHLDYSLKDVVRYLDKYEWQHLRSGENAEDDERVYCKISELAYKSYFYKFDDRLLKKVGFFENFGKGNLGYYHNKYLTVKYFLDMKAKQVADNHELDPSCWNFKYFKMFLRLSSAASGQRAGNNTRLTAANQLMYDIVVEGRKLSQRLNEGIKLHQLVSFDYKLKQYNTSEIVYVDYPCCPNP